MGRIMREIKSFSGAILSTTILLIAVFFIWNFLSSRNFGPLSTAASWVSSHANGSAYGSGYQAATTATTAAPVSYMGPVI